MAFEYVTLVAYGGTPVRICNSRGGPLPTTGTGALVFSDGPTLESPILNDPTFQGDYTVDGDFEVTGDLLVGGVIRSDTTGAVTSKTSSYTILDADYGRDFDNNGATGSVTFSLPAWSVGLYYGFAVMESHNLVIDAPSGVTIYLGEIATSPGGTLSSNSVGSYVSIKCRSATEWIAQSSMGSWSIT